MEVAVKASVLVRSKRRRRRRRRRRKRSRRRRRRRKRSGCRHTSHNRSPIFNINSESALNLASLRVHVSSITTLPAVAVATWEVVAVVVLVVLVLMEVHWERSLRRYSAMLTRVLATVARRWRSAA